MLDTTEHIDSGRLSRVERAVFGELGVQFVIIATPNKGYDPLHGMPDAERRHPIIVLNGPERSSSHGATA